MLTEKQRRFVDEYIIDADGAKAVARAGYKCKSPRVAANVAKELLQKPDIRAAIDERMEQLQSERVASAGEVLEYLTAVLRGEHIEEEVVIEGQGAGKSKARAFEKKLAAKDKLKAAELLGKRYGLFTDKLDVAGGALTVVVEHDYGEDTSKSDGKMESDI